MPIDDIYELAIIGNMQGQQVITTHTMRQRVADADLYFNANAPEDDLHASWVSNSRGAWLDLMPEPAGEGGGYTLETVRVRQLVPAGSDARSTREYAHGDEGDKLVNANHILAPWIVMHASVLTAKSGRSHRGRFFVSGVIDVDVHEGDLLNGGDGYSFALLLSYCGSTALGNFMGGNTDWQLGVFSRRLAGYPAPRRKSGAAAPVIPAPARAVDAFSAATGIEPHQRVSSLRTRRTRG